MLRKISKAFVLSLVLFVLASSSLWAFPGRASKAVETVEEEVPTQTALESVAESVSTKLETFSTAISEKVAEFENKATIKGEDKEALLAIVVAQDEDINELADKLDEAESTKIITRLTTGVGFEEGVTNPSFWLGGAVGARIGKHLLVDVGAEYNVYTLGGSSKKGLEKTRFSASVGWEF